MRFDEFINGAKQPAKPHQFTDMERAIMEGGGSLDDVNPVAKSVSALRQVVAEVTSPSLQKIIQAFIKSPSGQKYKKHDCKTVTRAFVQWAEQNNISTTVISLAPPSAEFIAKNPKFKGKSGEGDGHIMPVVNDNAIDFTVRQFGVARPFENPLVTPLNGVRSVYGKFGYFTDAPEWFLGGRSSWQGPLQSIPSSIFNQNFGDELLEAKVPSVRDQIIADVRKHGGDAKEYFVRFTDFEKLGFSANQGFGQTPDVDDPKFDIDYIGMGHGRRALWFYPLNTYLKSQDVYATEKPFAWLVRLKPTAWLQTVQRGDKSQLESPPAGKRRVGILRMSDPPAAIFFAYGFDVIGQYYNYADRHRRHGLIKGAPKPSWFDRIRGTV